MAGYTRQSTFADGDTITAALFNNEYNQLFNAFSNTNGHKHDGTAAEGPVIGLIGDAGETSPNNKVLIDTTNNHIEFYVEVSSSSVQQLYIADGAIVPVTDSDIDIGTTSLRFKDAYIDTVTTTGNVAVGGNLTVTGTTTFNGGTITMGDAATDNVVFGADVDSHIIPDDDDTYDLGSSTQEWRNLYIDGTAHIDTLDVDANATVAGTLGVTGVLTGTSLDISGDIDVDGTTNLDVVDIDGAVDMATTLTVGGEITAASLDISGNVDIDGTLETDALSINSTTVTSTAAELNILDGVTSTAAELNILDGVTSTTAELNILDGVTATATEINLLDGVTSTTAELNILDGVTATAAEINTLDGITSTVAELNILDGVTASATDINLIDGITNGTVIASKAIVTDANKDITGGRNITISGELDAATLDISGNADIDGTLEADAITIGGVTLAETISDTVGAMVSSNTETNITVTYDDTDNTLDFVIGTLNQDTTGNAATATALETARTIHGVSFDGTANIDLTEVVQDTVGAMFTSNTESGITVAYQDADGTVDFTVGTLNQDTTGNAATATALETARTIGGTSFDGTANIAVNLSATATALATARTIGGVSFDGTANIVPTTFNAATFSGDLNVDSGVLFADVSTNRVGINQTTPDVSLDLGANTDAIHVPVGTTAQRPASPAAGYFRYNTTTGGFEGYTDSWGAIAGSGGGTAPSLDTMTGDGSDTTLTLSTSPVNENATFVTIDGVLQHKDTYSISGNTLTFSEAPPSGSKVESITLTTTTSTTANILSDADSDTKVQVEESSDEDKIRFDTGGTERMIIDSTGVGIGTSSPSKKLHVYNTASADVALLESTQVFSTLAFKSSTNSSTVTVGIDGAGNASFENKLSTGNMTFVTNGSERMRIDSSGRVGIGTTSPTEKLTVNGAILASGALQDDRTSTAAIDFTSNVTRFVSYGASGVGGQFAFRTASGGASSAERVRIDFDGNVGIGTTDPADKLDIMGGGYDQIRIGSNKTDNTNKTAGIVSTMYTNNTVSFMQGFFQNGSNAVYYGSADSAHRGINQHYFYTNSNYNATSGHKLRYVINGNGSHKWYGKHQGDSVGHFLFTNNSSEDASNTNCTLAVQNGGTFIQIMGWTTLGARIGTRTGGWNSNSGGDVYFTRQDATSIKLASSGPQLGNGTAISSDQRLKENITDIADGQLAKICALTPRSFTWKDTRKKGTHEGFIAQEVESVIPEAVFEDNFAPDPDDDSRDFDGDIKLIKHEVINARLIKAVQELSAKLDAAEARIKTLEG